MQTQTIVNLQNLNRIHFGRKIKVTCTEPKLCTCYLTNTQLPLEDEALLIVTFLPVIPA